MVKDLDLQRKDKQLLGRGRAMPDAEKHICHDEDSQCDRQSQEKQSCNNWRYWGKDTGLAVNLDMLTMISS